MARKNPADALPAGWGFEDGRCLEAAPERDWRRVEDAIVALVASGYAMATASQRRKVRDTMDAFGLDGVTAERCLRTAQGMAPGGRRWKRRSLWCKKETPRPLETDRGADSRDGAKSRTDGPESIGRFLPAQAPHPTEGVR